MKNNKLTLSLIRTILLEELCLEGDRIQIYNQKFIIPKSKGMKLYIEPKSPPQIVSSRNRFVGAGYGGSEEQDSNWLEEISIGAYSRDLEALERKEEIVMALHSIYSQQTQEANSFKIYRNARIIPINEIEGAARLYRFDIECRVQSWYSKTKVAQFYDSHTVQVIASSGKTPDLEVEFVIPDTDPTVPPIKAL